MGCVDVDGALFLESGVVGETRVETAGGVGVDISLGSTKATLSRSMLTESC